MGQRLGAIARHLLLMTATPHAGSEEEFQAFLALLDPRPVRGPVPGGRAYHRHRGVMRRMVKEDLFTFEGKSTVPGTNRRDGALPALRRGDENCTRQVTSYVRDGDEPRRRARRTTPANAPSVSR